MYGLGAQQGKVEPSTAPHRILSILSSFTCTLVLVDKVKIYSSARQHLAATTRAQPTDIGAQRNETQAQSVIDKIPCSSFAGAQTMPNIQIVGH